MGLIFFFLPELFSKIFRYFSYLIDLLPFFRDRKRSEFKEEHVENVRLREKIIFVVSQVVVCSGTKIILPVYDPQ